MTLGTLANNLADVARLARERGWPDDRERLEAFGESLFLIGGGDLVGRVYSALAERHGLHAVEGVGDAWSDIPGWSER
jgi:hypothetical protein